MKVRFVVLLMLASMLFGLQVGRVNTYDRVLEECAEGGSGIISIYYDDFTCMVAPASWVDGWKIEVGEVE